MKQSTTLAFVLVGLLATSAAPPPPPGYTTLIRGGTIYDGSGGAPYVGDVALKGDRIVCVGPHAPGAPRAPSTRAARPSRRASSTC